MRKQLRGIKLAVMIAMALLLCVYSSASAQRSRRGPQTPTTAIPEDQRPSKVIPWVLGGVFTLGSVLLGLKNAKRTHLD